MPTHPSDLPLPLSTATFQLGDALPDATYASLQSLIDAYKAHSRGLGYGVVIRSSFSNIQGKRTVLACDRSGKPRERKQPAFNMTSTTQLAILRGAGSIEDLYDPVTLRERAYMQSLPIDRLDVECDMERLDKSDGNLAHELEMDQEWDLNLF